MSFERLGSVVPLAGMLLCAACGDGGTEGGGGGGPGGGSVVVPTPTFIETPPTFDAGDVSASEARFASIGRSPASNTYIFLPPNGNIRYQGSFIADTLQIGNRTGDSSGNYGLYGNADITVNFAGNNRISGSIDQVHFTEGGTPTELLTGSLQVAGRTDTLNTEFSIDVDGTLTGGFGTTERNSIAFDLQGAGEARRPASSNIFAPDNVNLAYIYSDNVTGSGSGSVGALVTDASLYGER